MYFSNSLPFCWHLGVGKYFCNSDSVYLELSPWNPAGKPSTSIVYFTTPADPLRKIPSHSISGEQILKYVHLLRCLGRILPTLRQMVRKIIRNQEERTRDPNPTMNWGWIKVILVGVHIKYGHKIKLISKIWLDFRNTWIPSWMSTSWLSGFHFGYVYVGGCAWTRSFRTWTPVSPNGIKRYLSLPNLMPVAKL